MDKRTRQTWSDMKQRYFNPRHHQYKNYGKRGITVCERWLSFDNFYADMGCKPNGKTLDRINNDGNYEASNCRWADIFQQRRNQRNCRYIEFDGLSMTVRDWARKLGISELTLHGRIRSGWSVEQMLTTTPNYGNKHRHFGNAAIKEQP